MEFVEVQAEAKRLTDRALGKRPEYDQRILFECFGILIAAIFGIIIFSSREDLDMFPVIVVAIYGAGRCLFVWWGQKEWHKQFHYYQEMLLADSSREKS